MRFSPLVIASCLTAFVTAFAQKHCVAFEHPTFWHQPSLTVSVDSGNASVLIYYAAELRGQLKTPVMLGETVTVPSNVLELCTPFAIELGKCLEEDTGRFINALRQRRNYRGDNFVNELLMGGKSVNFESKGQGIYCALVIHNSADDHQSGIRFEEGHLSGHTSVTTLGLLKVFLTGWMVYAFCRKKVFESLFPEVHQAYADESFWTLFSFMAKTRILAHVVPQFIAGAIYLGEAQYFFYMTPQWAIEEVYAILSMIVCYKLTLGILWRGRPQDVQQSGLSFIVGLSIGALSLLSACLESRWLGMAVLWDFLLAESRLEWPRVSYPSGPAVGPDPLDRTTRRLRKLRWCLSKFQPGMYAFCYTASSMVQWEHHVPNPNELSLGILDYDLMFARSTIMACYLWNPIIDVMKMVIQPLVTHL